MKYVGKLKGTSVSISDDLTPTTRSQKKIMLNCASDARNLGRNVKARSNFIIVDNVTVLYSELKNPNWLQSLQFREGSSAMWERKRQRTGTSSSEVHTNKEPKHSRKWFSCLAQSGKRDASPQ
jgi:hypothetical protein